MATGTEGLCHPWLRHCRQGLEKAFSILGFGKGSEGEYITEALGGISGKQEPTSRWCNFPAITGEYTHIIPKKLTKSLME